MRASKNNQNELIIYNPDTNDSRSDQEDNRNSRADVEIVILGPKSTRQSGANRLRLRPGSASAKSSSIGEDEDKDSVEAEQTDSNIKKAGVDGQDSQENQASSTNTKTTSTTTTKQVDDNLIKRLERRYRANGGAIVTDDDTYVDYMDYF